MNFSVLMSVYAGEQPTYLKEALGSIGEQTLLPKQLVIVKDGPLTPELEKVLLDFKTAFSQHIQIDFVVLVEQLHLGPALNEGLKYCQHDLVARMDSDDHCLTQRFEIQLAAIGKQPEVKIMGAQIQEFNEDWQTVVDFRQVPQTPAEIYAFSRKRNPMNHMSVLFKKDYIDYLGGYQDIPGFEDYDLWLRALKDNPQVIRNVSQVLVAARVGRLQDRRGGWRYLKQNGYARCHFYHQHLIGGRALAMGLVGSTVVSCSPAWLRKKVYQKFLRNEGT